MVKEGAAGGDGSSGLSIQCKGQTDTHNAVLILHGKVSDDDVENLFWKNDSEPNFYGLGAFKSSRKMQYVKFHGFGQKKVDCVLKKFSLKPTNIRGTFDIEFSIYVRDPSKELVFNALQELKDVSKIHVEQTQADLIDDAEETDE